MAKEAPKRLSAEEAKFKVIECRDMAKHAMNPEHRIMLEHMAETWERIAAEIAKQRTH
jgi:hypothetical protein